MEFCRSHGLALSTLGRHMRKQRSKHSESRSKGVEQGRLVPVEVAAPVASIAAGKVSAAAIVCRSTVAEWKLEAASIAATLAQLVTVLERL